MNNKNSLQNNFSMISESPFNLPEDLKKLLIEEKENEQNCSECYDQIPEWMRTNDNLKEYVESIQNNLQTPQHSPHIKNVKEEKNKNMEQKETNNGFWKFNEDKTLEAAKQYIQSTYHQHYTSEESKVQVLDIIESIGDGVPFCRDNLIKYSARFGKKNGFSKLDAMKIIHYGILLYNFAGFHKETTNDYETF